MLSSGGQSFNIVGTTRELKNKSLGLFVFGLSVYIAMGNSFWLRDISRKHTVQTLCTFGPNLVLYKTCFDKTWNCVMVLSKALA